MSRNTDAQGTSLRQRGFFKHAISIKPYGQTSQCHQFDGEGQHPKNSANLEQKHATQINAKGFDASLKGTFLEDEHCKTKDKQNRDANRQSELKRNKGRAKTQRNQRKNEQQTERQNRYKTPCRRG